MKTFRKRNNLPSYIWIIAFLVFPSGPYIPLYFSGAISKSKCIYFFILAQSLSSAFTYCMIKTEGRRDIQLWVLISFLLFLSLAAIHQFQLGKKLYLWPRNGLRTWKLLGTIYFIMFLLMMASAVVSLAIPGLKDV